MEKDKDNVKIDQLMKEMIILLEKNNEVEWSLTLRRLLMKDYDIDNRTERVKNILKLYQGGMGSFNDLVLQKNGKILIEEDQKLDELSGDLYNACVHCLVGTKEDFFINEEKNDLNINLDVLEGGSSNFSKNPKDNKNYDKMAVPSEGSQTPKVRPWIRFFARYIDIYLFGFVVGIFLEFFSPSSVQNSNIVFGIALLFLWIFIESVFLSLCGTTFGKWLLGVKIRDNKNKKLTFLVALKRSFLVWFKGFGIGFPIISLFTLVSAHSDLTNKNITTWDKDCHLTVVHQKLGVARTAFATLIIGLFIIICIGIGLD